MSYLLDTNVCILYLNQKDTFILKKLQALAKHEVFLCDIVKFELLYGAYKSRHLDRNLTKLKLFFNELNSIPFDDKALWKAAYIRSELAKAGTIIGPYDIQIAAIALVNQLTLVTHNVKEFSRIPDLSFEDWECLDSQN